MNPYIIEYSPSQNAFHIETLEESIQLNLRNFLNGHCRNRLVLGFFKTHNEALRRLPEIQQLYTNRTLQ